MSEDIRAQVCEKLRMSPAKASMQLDQSTDVANLSQLLVYLRYVSGNKGKKNSLCANHCMPQLSHGTSKTKLMLFFLSTTSLGMITMYLFALMVHLLC